MEKLKLENVKKELATKNALTLKEQTDVKGGCYSGKNPNVNIVHVSGTGGGTSGNMRRPNQKMPIA